MPVSKSERDLIVISGFYGFGNLGDEAILEQLVSELKQLVPPEKIVVLSANPQATARSFGVRAEPRADPIRLLGVLSRARLLISGGGGLFQDTRSPGSAIFYGLQILLSRLCGARAIIYAQGVGPLRSSLAGFATKTAFSMCSQICLRDAKSLSLVESWGLPAELTADPVWCLEPSALPPTVQTRLDQLAAGQDAEHPVVGLSLRPSSDLSDHHLDTLLSALSAALPAGARLLLLPLQKKDDEPLLKRFQQGWLDLGRQCLLVDPDELTRPSQWINLLGKLDFLVAMRLHALIMALRSAVPVVGIAYDPKVTGLLTEFAQPILILTKENNAETWRSTLNQAYGERKELSARARDKAEGAKNMACQNFNVISRILSMQSDP